MSARKARKCGFTDGIFGRTPDLAYTNHPVKIVREWYEAGFKSGGQRRAQIEKTTGPITFKIPRPA